MLRPRLVLGKNMKRTERLQSDVACDQYVAGGALSVLTGWQFFPKEEDALYIGLECDVIIKIQEKYYLWTTVDLSSKTGNHSCLD